VNAKITGRIKMKMANIVACVFLVACIISFPATADGGRECVFDPDTGLLVPANGSGACFADFGFDASIFDDGEVVIAFNGPDANQWARGNPNDKGFFHTSGNKNVVVVYCSAATVSSNACNPSSEEPFVGIGKVMLNSNLTSDGFFICPATIRIRGTGTDGYGNSVEFKAALTLVPDADFGCKVTVVGVDASPLFD
jgi:hypothetical protein